MDHDRKGAHWALLPSVSALSDGGLYTYRYRPMHGWFLPGISNIHNNTIGYWHPDMSLVPELDSSFNPK
jgi:hypothetical protein